MALRWDYFFFFEINSFFEIKGKIIFLSKKNNSFKHTSSILSGKITNYLSQFKERDHQDPGQKQKT